MRLSYIGGALSLAVLGLAACGGGGGEDDGGITTTSPTVAAATGSGPGVSDAQHCAVPYGDAPAQLPPLGSLSGTLADLINLFNQCVQVGGETLSWTDAQGEQRKACLITPPQASSISKLPLVVFLQGSLFPAPVQLILNHWVSQARTADLTGDPQRPGFVLLLPIGRNTHHFYPFPNNYALGFDNWYRDLDRSSAGLNLDVAAIDQFIGEVEGRGIVDSDRVYATGWSNGAALAQLYALNTPSIAASAVYSSPDPFTDFDDPCEQTPFATVLTPLMDIHNACDIGGICQTGMKFHQDLARRYPGLRQSTPILDTAKNQVEACDASCAPGSGSNAGNVNHIIWPQNWNAAMFTWLREHPLSARHR